MDSNTTKRMSPKFVGLVCIALLSACSTPKSPGDKYGNTEYDPIEPLNRAIFQFNYAVDGVIVKPLTEGYEAIMPAKGQEMVSNAVDNIKEPTTIVNSILQADARNTFSALWRFVINSTVGVGGLFDAATAVGLKERATGLGDTMAIYGADSGAYVVLPFFGPTSVRDGIGFAGDVFSAPVTYADNAVLYSVAGVKTIDTRHRNMKVLNDIYNNSLDPYVSMRSIYTQHRSAAVKTAIKARNESLDLSKKQCHKD